MKHLFFVSIAVLLPVLVSAGTASDSLTVPDSLQVLLVNTSAEHAVFISGEEVTRTEPPAQQQPVSRKKIKENVKVVAAVLAFPPFGMVGLHRIYLGTKPYIPIIYLVTFGGCLGVLPLIDCVYIATRSPEELEKLKGNSKIFMWLK